MSNFDSKKKTPKTKALSQKSSVKNNAKTRWSIIQSHLGSAASDWTESEQKNPIKSVEEVQFEKMKDILVNLKDQLKDF